MLPYLLLCMLRKEGKLLDFFDVELFDETHGKEFPKIREIVIRLVPKEDFSEIFDIMHAVLIIIYYNEHSIEYVLHDEDDEEEIKQMLSYVFGDIDVCICLERVDEDHYAFTIRITKYSSKLLEIQYLLE